MEDRNNRIYTHQKETEKIRKERETENTKENIQNINREIKQMLISYHTRHMQGRRERKSVKVEPRECAFCKTKETSLWRRAGNSVVCNACGLYYRIHGKVREVNKNKNDSSSNTDEE